MPANTSWTLPVAVPADDIGRKMAVKAAREGLEEAGMEGFEQAVRRSVGDDLAGQVFRQMDLEDDLIGGICFEAGTPVAAAEGLTPIETVEVGDLVWAADLETGVVGTFTVTEVFSHPVQSLLEVVIGDDRIRVTEEHPFWVTGKGWVSAEALEPGDCVRTLAGTCQAIVSVQLASADTWVYNLTVARVHTYFVGDRQWLVHNKCRRLIDGMSLSVDEDLDAAEDFLEPGYRGLGNGRFVSADGLRQVRMGDSDILGHRGGGSHMNFETLAPNPANPRKLKVVENLHIYLVGP